MHRRRFFTGITALLVATPAASLLGGAQPPATHKRMQQRAFELRAEMLRHVRSLQTRHAIGSAWLAAQEPPPSLDNLLDALTARLASTPLAPGAPTDIPGLIAVSVQKDFRNGQTVSVRGWILAETEVRLCGAACLLARDARLS